MERYKILFDGGEGELTEKKSRFIATTRPVASGDRCSAAVMTENRHRLQAVQCWMCFLARK